MKNYKIVNTTVKMASIKLEQPFPLGFGVLYNLPRVFLFIKAQSTDGTEVEGCGEASIDFPFSGYDAYDIYDALLKVNINGICVADIGSLLHMQEYRDKLLSFTPAAFCAFNMAIDDLLGKLDGKSVADMYGRKRDFLPIMSSIGFMSNVQDFLDEVQRRFQMGYLPKIKVGKNIFEDIETFAILDKNLPSRIKLAVDFNGKYSKEESKELLGNLFYVKHINPKRFWLWEQPTRKCFGIQALNAFKKQLIDICPDCVVIADESFINVEDAIHCSEYGIGLNYKIHKIGGLYIAHEIEQELSRRKLFKKHSLVGGTFPTAIGRAYDIQSAYSLSSTCLPSDGMEPATNWFRGEKDFAKKTFTDKTGGLQLSINLSKLQRFFVDDPKKEYSKIRNDKESSKMNIQIVNEGSSYSHAYASMTGRDPNWNLT